MRPKQDYSAGLRELTRDAVGFASRFGQLAFETIERMLLDGWWIIMNLPNLIVVELPNLLVYDKNGQMRKNIAYFLLRPPAK